jgi:VCBS repeat-containing protein
MTNHNPVFTSSSATGSFTETANTTDSTALHLLSGTMNFKDSDHGDTHTTSATLSSAVLSSGSIIPASSLADFQAMTSQITSDSNGSGKLTWSFSDADHDFDFLSKDQTLVLTYNITLSDNNGGTTTQTVKIAVTGTDDKPVINMIPVATVTEQANQTLSLSPDTAHVMLNFTDDDLTNTGYTASVISASATGTTSGLLPGTLGTAELMAFFQVDSVVKNSGSSAGTINTTFTAPDLAFDYLAAGEQLNVTYTVQLDDHAGGVSTQNVVVTVIGTNDKPVYLTGPQTAHLVEDQNVDPSGNLTAHRDLFFTDVDLSDTHTVSTTVSTSITGGGPVPISDADLLAAFKTTLEDSTHHVLGEVDADFAIPNTLTSAIGGGQTLTATYHVTVVDSAGASSTQDVTITILGTNHPVVITSGPESSTVSELADTTGSAIPDTTPTVPAGTLAFTDPDTGDTHAVAVTLASTSGSAVPAATQADLATALTTILHDSTGTGSGTIDWNFAIADHDFDYLAAGETLTVNYDVKVSDATTSSTQTVSVVVTGANDAPVIGSGPESASLAEQAGVTGSSSLDSTSPVPTGTLAFTDVDLSDVHTVGVALTSATWSANPFVPGDTFNDLQTALATALHDSTGTGSGGIDWTFSIPDKDLDFLGAGETLTATYDVTVMDGTASSTQTVTVTIDGAADGILVNPFSGSIADTSSTDDGNVVAVGNIISDAGDSAGDAGNLLSVTAVNGSAANVGAAIAGAFGTLVVDSTGFYTYTANANLDALQVGDSVTENFTFTVSDTMGHDVPTTLTFNVSGADDAPIVTSAIALGTLAEDAGPTVGVNGGFETGDLTGWSSSGVTVTPTFIGGELGNYAAQISSSGFLKQDVATVAGQHYTLSFFVAGDTESSSTAFKAFWDGAQIAAKTDVTPGFTKFTFDVVGDASDPTTQLFFDFTGNNGTVSVDQMSLSPTPGPATAATDGNIHFSDVETADTHTASFTPDGSGYLGTFSLDPVIESSSSGSLTWHYSVDNADIQFLAQGQSLIQSYSVSITDSHGATTVQDITVAIAGSNDVPTAVNDNVIADAGANGLVDIPSWMLTANDTDPDTIDHLSVNSVGGGSGGSAVQFGDAIFLDDATPGGSFTYTATDGIATSNTATATVTNNDTSVTALSGTSGDDIIIADNAGTLSGGGGNDILVANSAGSHVMTGGSGNDTFAFLQTTNGPTAITDFNNTTEHDHIAISASGFGGGLTAGMDVTPLFETSGDDQFSGSGPEFHFDTGNQTLYFSADGTQTQVTTLATVQAGVVLNPHDLLIV